MAGKPKPPEEEGGEGAPLWIISFADMISLLMAFFVMLSTFSNFGPGEAAKLKKVGKSALSPNYYGGWLVNPQRAAMGHQAAAAGQDEKGSEKPTLEKGLGKSLLAETGPKDFRTRKIFLIESRKVFWASGTALSAEGRDFLDTLVSYLGKLPDRIIVSENGPGDNAELGTLRAVVVVEYLGVKGVSKDRCGIGIKAMSPDNNFKTERMLEISLLDEGAYE
jgi:outer membrane protein OmpA-like peptidoglycan-associated protein